MVINVNKQDEGFLSLRQYGIKNASEELTRV